jgi:hypothetical protein
MELNTHESNIISSTRKTNCVHFNYYISNVLILRSECRKDLGVMLDIKLYFNCHVNLYILNLGHYGLYVSSHIISLP